MKNLVIQLSANNAEFGNADYILIKENKKNFSSLILEGFRSMTNKINKHDILDFRIFYKNKLYSEFEITALEDLLFSSSTEIKIDKVSIPEKHFYNQDVIDIFKTWDDSIQLDWRSLNNEKKKAWLTACLFWSGLPKSLAGRENFIIDSSSIESKTDFYCALGEVFFDQRGYFGQDLDGLSDCMIDLEKSGNVSVKFLYFDKLQNILDKTSKGYTRLIVDLFRTHGFNVITEP